MYRYFFLLSLPALFLLAVAGCQGNQTAGNAASEATAVPVSQPVQREVTNFVDFTGRTDAVEVVDLKARVTGYLTKMPFREGSEVKRGDLLFEVDPRPYEAQLNQAKSQVELNEASLKLAQTNYNRDRAISAAVPNAVSQQQLDQDIATVEEAVARLKASKESTKVYELNLEFTRVMSPIDGQVSRYYMTRGNLVNQDQTLLTTVVSLDPMYAYFDMDEPTLLRIRRAIIEGRTNLPEDGTMPVFMGLQGEEGFPHNGTINFLNNQVNSATGSISMRGVFPNPLSAGALPVVATSTVGYLSSPLGQGALLGLPAPVQGKARASTRLLSPGMFVRIRLPIGEPRQELLVKDQVIQSDQGLKYVYVVDADNKVQSKRVTTRALQDDGLRVVRGLSANDWVVVGALQQVRPRMQVQMDKTPMPSLGHAPANGDAKKVDQPK
jgi:membrane fusion protein, multidrug efflux system